MFAVQPLARKECRKLQLSYNANLLLTTRTIMTVTASNDAAADGDGRRAVDPSGSCNYTANLLIDRNNRTKAHGTIAGSRPSKKRRLHLMFEGTAYVVVAVQDRITATAAGVRYTRASLTSNKINLIGYNVW